MQSIEERLRFAARMLALVGLGGLLALSLLTTLDVALRWLFGLPIHGVNDISSVVMAVVIAACLPTSFAEKQNISVDILGSMLGRRANAVLSAFGSLVTLIFIAIMAWHFVPYAHGISESGQRTWVLGWPVGPWWWAATAMIVLSVPVQAMVLVKDAIDIVRPLASGESASAESADPIL